jgi:NADH dehydrogenase FAD-containing subunit
VGALWLRPPEWFAATGVDVRRGAAGEVVSVDVGAREVVTRTSERLAWAALVLATGSDARTGRFPGAELRGVHTLRSVDDSAALAASVRGALAAAAAAAPPRAAHVVIAGSSFVGMEAAVWCRGLAPSERLRVTVLGLERAPFERVFGLDIGCWVRARFEAMGVAFRLGEAAAVALASSDAHGHVAGVTLASGEALPADVVLLGIGAAPVVPPMPGVARLRDGSVATDACLGLLAGPGGARVRGAFAVGDIASFPHEGGAVRIEHWDVAQQHARVAARNAVAEATGATPQPYRDVPFFWTALGAAGAVRLAGVVAPGAPADAVVFEGGAPPAPDATRFVAAFVDSRLDRVRAVATLGADPVAVAAAALLREGRMPRASALGVGWAAALVESARALPLARS